MAFSPAVFKAINEEIAQDVKDELRLQGHIATGALEDSFVIDEIFDGPNIILQAKALGYIKELEEGVPASQINVSATEFQKLVSWVQLRGMAKSFTEAKQVAYFIIKKWKTEGKPLETSKQFSQTGEILHAVQFTFESWIEKYAQMFNETIKNLFNQDLKLRIKGGEI